MRLLKHFIAVAIVFGLAHHAFAETPPPDTEGPPIRFFADLSADEESAVTESPGIGRVEFSLDRKTLQLSWKVTFSGLTSPPVRLAIHGPQTPGGEAGVLIDMAPHGVKSPTEGSAILNDGELEYLTSDRLYVNIATTKYKNGELRGPIKRMRPKASPPVTQ